MGPAQRPGAGRRGARGVDGSLAAGRGCARPDPPRRVGAALRPARAVQRGSRPRRADALLLPRAVLGALPRAARGRVDPAGAHAGRRRARPARPHRGRARRLRVRDGRGALEPEDHRCQQPQQHGARELAVLRPEHLRPVPDGRAPGDPRRAHLGRTRWSSRGAGAAVRAAVGRPDRELLAVVDARPHRRRDRPARRALRHRQGCGRRGRRGARRRRRARRALGRAADQPRLVGGHRQLHRRPVGARAGRRRALCRAPDRRLGLGQLPPRLPRADEHLRRARRRRLAHHPAHGRRRGGHRRAARLPRAAGRLAHRAVARGAPIGRGRGGGRGLRGDGAPLLVLRRVPRGPAHVGAARRRREPRRRWRAGERRRGRRAGPARR